MNLKDLLSRTMSSLQISCLNFSKNKLNLLAGEASCGKTSFLTFLAGEVIREQKPILFITLDETTTEIFYKIASNLSLTKVRDLKNPQLKSKQVLEQVTEKYNKLVSIEGSSIDDINKVLEYIHLSHKNGVETIFIDALNLVGFDKRANFSEKMNKSVSTLINKCEELNVTMIVSSTTANQRDLTTPAYLLNKKAHLFYLEKIFGNLHVSDSSTKKIFKFLPDYDKNTYSQKGEPLSYGVFDKTSKEKILRWHKEKNYPLVAMSIISKLHPGASPQEGFLTTDGVKQAKTIEGYTDKKGNKVLGSSGYITDHIHYLDEDSNTALLYTSNLTEDMVLRFENLYVGKRKIAFILQDLNETLKISLLDKNIKVIIPKDIPSLIESV